MATKTLTQHREQAAVWYDTEALACVSSGHGATASMFRRFAARIRNGDADHRLAAVIAGQAEYDA